MTQSQQKASNPAHSAWVSANAGTGKTKVLTERVLRLLLQGVRPQRILCITYTKAAAAEMKTRVQKVLAGWTILEEAQLAAQLEALTDGAADRVLIRRARRLFATVLDAPDGVRIETIHGLCQSLLRRFPLEAGTQPHFTVIDDRSSADLLKEARLRMFAEASRGTDTVLTDALTTLAGQVSESGLSELLKELIAERSFLTQLLSRRGGIIRLNTELWHHLGFPYYGFTSDDVFTRHFTYSPNQLRDLRRIADIMREGKDSDINLASSLETWLSQPETRHHQTESYCQAYLTAEGKIRDRLPTKETRARLDGLLEAFEEEARRVQAFREEWRAWGTAFHTERLFTVADGVFAYYRHLKTVRAFLDYEDLILYARRLLYRPDIAPWVLYKLDGGLDHLLIDEAQDTSPEQWDLVKALVDEFYHGQGRSEAERTLFVVGDQKQSIFSFQGADPRRFSQMQEYFANAAREAGVAFEHVALERSFRSTESVLQLVDAVFSQERARSGVTQGGESITHVAHREGQAGRVELWPLIEAEDKSNDTPEPWSNTEQRWNNKPQVVLARKIADTVAGWLRDGERLESRDRPVRAGDILILVRSRGTFAGPMIRALKQRAIPVAGADRMRLGEQLAVQDMVALGQALLLPEDSLTLATVLKGPLLSLSEEDLFLLAHGRGKQTLWRRMEQESAQHPQIAYALERLREWMRLTDVLSPYALFARVLEAEGGRKAFAARLGEECFDPLDEFLNQALMYERAYPPSLQGFLDWLLSADSEIKRDMESGTNEVRVMTVHGSKGLQAPIVFMPDTTSLQRLDDSLYRDESPPGTLLWSYASTLDSRRIQQLKLEKKALNAEETRRLLYVALTRAEDRLYICGWDHSKRNEECWYNLIRAGMEPLAKEGEDGVLYIANPQTSQPKPEKETESEIALPPFPRVWLHPAPDEPVPPRPLSPSRLEAETPVLSPRSAGDPFRRGRLIHRLLQSLPEAASEDRPAAIRRYLNRQAADWPEAELEQLSSEVLAVLNDPEFAPVFAEGSLAEAPVAGVITINGVRTPIAGQIDRLRITERDIWIIDYKTNRDAPIDAANIPLSYLRQMEAYRSALAAIYPNRRIHAALLFTAVPKLMTLDESVLLPLTA